MRYIEYTVTVRAADGTTRIEPFRLVTVPCWITGRHHRRPRGPFTTNGGKVRTATPS